MDGWMSAWTAVYVWSEAKYSVADAEKLNGRLQLCDVNEVLLAEKTLHPFVQRATHPDPQQCLYWVENRFDGVRVRTVGGGIYATKPWWMRDILLHSILAINDTP